MQTLNLKLRGNVYEWSLNTIFFAELNLIASFSIYESLCKKWRVQRRLIVKCELWLSFECKRCYWVGNSSRNKWCMRCTLSLKHDLGSWHFATEENLRSVVTKFFTKQDAEWYSASIHKLILRYYNCFEERGDYVEK